MEVRDGTGQGFRAKVDDENRLHVDSISEGRAYHANELHGEAYSMDLDDATTDGANYWVAIIKNTADIDLHVSAVTLWTPAFDNTQIVEADIGGTFVYASNGTAVVPTNANAGSGKSAVGSFYVNDGTGNITTVVAGSIVGRHIFSTTPIKWQDDAQWILPKNQCFMLWSNIADTLTGYISFYYHNTQ